MWGALLISFVRQVCSRHICQTCETRSSAKINGEIDVIAEDGPNLVVVEVKTRSSRSHGTALESVGQAKLARLRMLAAKWLTTQPRTFDTVRVDVIALERFAGDYSLRHVRGAI